MPSTRTELKESQPLNDGVKTMHTDDSFPKTKFLLACDGIDESSIISLRHPKSGSSALFHYQQDNVYELLETGGEFRSWFWNETVVSDGSLTISTPINPAFLCLPYLMQNATEHFVTLDQILVDEKFPSIVSLCENAKVVKSLKVLSDFKEVSDVTVFRYNSEKLIGWLENKMHQLKEALILHGQLHPNLLESEKHLLQYTWSVLSDYLSSEVSALLQKHLGIEIEAVAPKSPEKRKRKVETTEPTENYFDEKKAAPKKVKEQTANEKKLAKAASGTKSLTSFFKKK